MAPFTPEQHRAYRAKMKEQGICIMCHSNETVDGRATCHTCQERTLAARKERRIRYREEGKCVECGLQLPDGAEGYLCPIHQEQVNWNQMRKRGL